MQLIHLPIQILMAVAVVAWLVAAFSFFGMLANTKQGWTSLVFRFGWWLSSDMSQYLTADGIAHHRRFMKAFVWFFGAILAAIAYVGVLLALDLQ